MNNVIIIYTKIPKRMWSNNQVINNRKNEWGNLIKECECE